METTAVARVSVVDGYWHVNGERRGWTTSTPFYVVYYALRWVEGFASVEGGAS